MKTINELSPREFVLTLVKQQVQPALGCTEIGIVSLACAKASSLLKTKLKSARVTVSPYVFRNDSRVGVPRLGRCGMKVIAAAGLILKNPLKLLNCLDDLTVETIAASKKLGAHDNKTIAIDVDYSSHPVYTRCQATDTKGNEADVIIQYSHDNIIQAKLNGKETLDPSQIKGEVGGEDFDFDARVDQLTIQKVFEVCQKLKKEEVEFLKDGIEMNDKVVKEGYKNPDPNSLSNVFIKLARTGKECYGFGGKKSWTTKVLAAVCYAVDARMYGCPLPVMTSSRSGDHGLTVSIPQQIHAQEFKVKELTFLRACMFAHFVTWKIKSKVGHLCGMCGSVVGAGAGTIAGLAFQRGWEWSKVNDLINMYLVSASGIICDGAKPSCSFKILSALSAGFLCMAMADNGGKLEHKDGIVHRNVEETISNLGKYSKTTQDSIIVNVVDLLNAMQKLQ